jgi:hypothetical protein
MKIVFRQFVLLFFFAQIFLAPPSLFAKSPFEGKWRTNLDQSNLSLKPVIFSLKNGRYTCSSCAPRIDVKADGQDQPVAGQPYDTIRVREIDPESIAITTMKNGKIVDEQTCTVSDERKTLTVNTTSHLQDSNQTVSSKATFVRIGNTTEGANGTSGSWRINKVQESENGLIMNYKSEANGLSFSTPTGESWTAKFDGKDYPVKGSYYLDSVSLKRLDDRAIEETGKRDGKVVEVSKVTITDDGKMTTVAWYKQAGRTSIYVAEKK